MTYLSEASRVLLGPPAQAALLAAGGNRKRAAAALGIHASTLDRRANECTVIGEHGPEPLRTWMARQWPSRGGRTSVAVASWSYEGTNHERVRVYVLAAHGDIKAGAHIVRAPAVGATRERVVCKVCKAKESGE